MLHVRMITCKDNKKERTWINVRNKKRPDLQNLPSQNLSLGHFIITCVGIVAEGIISIDYFISSSFSFAC